MKMNRYVFLICCLMPVSSMTEEKYGKVCFGKNLSKVADEHSDRLYLKIDNSKKLYFNRKHDGAVLANLDLARDHVVKVYFGDQLGMSWKFNFTKRKTRRVLIWRSAGSWRMEAVSMSQCN